MALNWQHIKGVYNKDGNPLPLYTYIEFSNNNTALKTVDVLPSLYVSTNNLSSLEEIKTGATELGKIITSKAINQTIDVPFVFKDTLSINYSKDKALLKLTNNTTSLLEYAYIDNKINIKSNNILFKAINNDVLELNKDEVKIHAPKLNTKDIIITKGFILKVGDDTKVNAEYIQAPYFNATSDIRAKENILPFNQNALDIINKLQTYTYNYKDSKQKSYGIMAQDMLNVNINDFSFVENVAATGTDGDYMSIHESKLVYLLIEGMKEQQKEIQSLKKELEELKNGK